jgi:uncharacterized protein YqfA (UPF0365 family)
MEIPGTRTWIIYFLISFVVLLWAVFLSVKGVMLWVSLTLAVVVIGINLMTLVGELRSHTKRQELMRELSLIEDEVPALPEPGP